MISFSSGCTIDCVVKNVSDAGAGLIVESPVGIPDDFKLVIERDNFIRRCHVIWRTSSRIGVEFKP